MQMRSCSGSPRREELQVGDGADEVALAVEHDYRGSPIGDRLEIVGDQVLQRLRLAVPGAGDDMW
jgi:hypothetical protein